MKFRKKPVIIEARHWATEDDAYELADWCGGDYDSTISGPSGVNGEDWGLLVIGTLEGEMTAAPGDWIIRGVKGEFYPCKPDIFAATHEPVEDDQ